MASGKAQHILRESIIILDLTEMSFVYLEKEMARVEMKMVPDNTFLVGFFCDFP